MIEDADNSGAIMSVDDRTLALIQAFSNAFALLDDQRGYLEASKFRVEFLRRNANLS